MVIFKVGCKIFRLEFDSIIILVFQTDAELNQFIIFGCQTFATLAVVHELREGLLKIWASVLVVSCMSPLIIN